MIRTGWWLFLSWTASAAVPDVVLDPHGWAAGDDTYDLLLETAAGMPEVERGARVMVPGRDGVLRPLSAYEPTSGPPPRKEEGLYRSLPTVHPGRADGALSGRAVYVSQCHGFMYYDSAGRFETQRPNIYDTIEDFHNPEGANAFLIPYLENAGAAVFTARERDTNPLQAIADNDGQGYAESGSGFVTAEAGFGERTTYAYGVDPFEEGTTRRLPAAGGGVATWRPDVPADGTYAIYVAWDSHPSHASDAHYRITHPGGVIDRWFDQTVHGSTWQYVETLWLPAGSAGLTVELLGDASDAGAWLSADAVRVGGGTDDVERRGDLTGHSRWQSSAIQYTQYNGAPSSVYDWSGNGVGTDHVARSKWAAWEHPAGEDAVYVSWHSNATGQLMDSARGTSTYFAGGGADAPGAHPASCSSGVGAVTGSYSLAQLLSDELIDAFRLLWEPGWSSRGTDGINTACFSEVSPTLNSEMPSALVEMAFHNNETDAAYLKHPEFRRDASRAMYRAIVRYFAERDGISPIFLPEPPRNLALVHDDDGALNLSWEAGATGAPWGDPPEGYLVETSLDGRVWSQRFAVSGRQTTLGLNEGHAAYVRVIATNAGGMSFPSEVIGARRSPEGLAPVLVVAGFDRLDGGLLPFRSASPMGSVVTMDLPRMNPFDTAVAAGEAILAAGWFFDSVSDERFSETDLSPYSTVVWLAGEESSATTTVSADQQLVLEAFIAGGGTLWISGAELLWDLDEMGDVADRAFASDVLGAGMASDDAGTTRVSGEGVLADVGPLDFGEAQGAPYPVEWPDVLDTSREVIARYATGEVAGAMGGGVAVFGFPFEAIGDPSVRAEVAEALLASLAPDVDPPEVDIDPDDPWEEDPSDPEEPIAGTATRVPVSELGGCACAGASGRGAGLLILPLLVALTRRRRLCQDPAATPDS